jgi:hypothetical protein
MQLKPTKLTSDQLVKLVKVAAYLAASAAVTALITFVTDNQDLFGPLFPLINWGLVVIKQVFTEE